MHGDIKPLNVLAPRGPLTANRLLRLTDFGFATRIKGHSASFLEARDGSGGGTPEYAPPEFLAHRDINEQEVSPAYDMFSIGLIAFELLTGGKVQDCRSDDGISDVKHLVHPPGYVGGKVVTHSTYIMGQKEFPFIHMLLQLLQVLGMPSPAEKQLIPVSWFGSDMAPYGNPYDDDHDEGFGQKDLTYLSSQARSNSQFHLHRAVFSVQSAITGNHAMAEERNTLKSLHSGLLDKRKYMPRLEKCAEENLKKLSATLVESHREGLDLIQSMLRIWPPERITVKEALAHPFMGEL